MNVTYHLPRAVCRASCICLLAVVWSPQARGQVTFFNPPTYVVSGTAYLRSSLTSTVTVFLTCSLQRPMVAIYNWERETARLPRRRAPTQLQSQAPQALS